VELTHEGFTEKFEADGVNVSQGGLAMRASYLPDVGARLRCRFPGARGALVEAGAEVVWSSDKGPHTGEFGLRFLDLDDEASRALRRLLHGRSYRPPAPGESHCAEDTIDEPVGPNRISLEIDDVSAPIRAGVVSEDEDVLTVSQELPFLKLKTGVTVQKDGRRGRIEGIDLLVDGETPRLMIDIVFDEAVSDSVGETTVPDFEPVAPVSTSQDTAVDLSSPETVSAYDDELDEAIEEALDELSKPKTRVVHVAPATNLVDTPSVDTAIPGSIDEALASVVAEPEEAKVETAETDEELAAALVAKNGPAEVLKDIRVRLVALLPKLRLLLSRVRPALVMLTDKARTFWGTFRAERAPKLAAAIEKALAFAKRGWHALSTKLGEKLPALAQRTRRRRKTSPPPTDSNVARRRGKQKRTKGQKSEKRRRRTILLSALAFVGVGLAVWALTPGDETVDAADPLAGHEPLVADDTTAAPAAPTSTTPASAPAPAPASSAAAAAPATPSMPRAVGEASREAGPMPAPTFPSLSEGARPQAPQALPEGSPYAVDVREGGGENAAPATASATSEGTLFGAPDVPGGRSYLIRMSQPVSVVRGAARADGFTVTIPDSLSLDRAGPIAASHPLVERSMILNRGDHAELTITFVEGQSPTYRVSARGSAIEVLIARR
jgi:hypothetical protein